MKRTKLLCWIALLAGIGLSSCFKNRAKLPSLKETYRNDDKKPFGAFVTFREISLAYKHVQVILNDNPVFDKAKENNPSGKKEGHTLYFILTDKLYPSAKDMNRLINYVREGNDLFISANQFSEKLLKQIDIRVNPYVAHLTEELGGMRNTRVRIFLGKDIPDIPYGIYYYPFNNYMLEYDKDRTEILGKDDAGNPNFAVVFLGKGRLYFHMAPRALSNYFLLTGENINYLRHILEFIRPDPATVFWDEHFNRVTSFPSDEDDPKQNFSSLDVIRSQPMLKWALLLATAGLCIFILFNSRRKQRIVPPEASRENVSLDFINTIARLYFVHKDNRNIALKLITYFYENVRNKYAIKTTSDMEQFAILLAGKRGYSIDAARELLTCIRNTESSETVRDDQLLYLNRLLENFYNYK